MSTSDTASNRQDAENVLQKYREHLETSEDRDDLETLTQTTNNEFFEDLVKTIKKLRERLNQEEEPHGNTIRDDEIRVSSIAVNVGDTFENIYDATESNSGLSDYDIARRTKYSKTESPTCQVLSPSETSGEQVDVHNVSPPCDAEPDQEVQYQEGASSATETYQEIIVQGDNVTEDMVKMVETALKNGILESGTSFIIVDKSDHAE